MDDNLKDNIRLEMLRQAYRGVFEHNLIVEISEKAKFLEFQEGDVLIEIGKYIRWMPLILKGAIRVMREDPDAGELFLYHIEKGETCAITLVCCMGDQKSEIRAVAENPGWVAQIPVGKMEQWMGGYKSWRNFVFHSYANRFNELLSAIDNIAFMNMSERLELYLKEISKVTQSTSINKTHKEIAAEMNSSRVVISRLLKAFENDGKIRLNRNNIELLEPLQ
ncbi:MAG TPA: Crp/Fnr family transcriptional regulator [Membranihabitans sp.]|nr:Crp/Fnr family transcriptional regulator [Membranihabitans sp.]